jgi:integrase
MCGWSGPPFPPEILTNLAASTCVWADRLRREPAAPADRTVGFWADKWLANKVEEAKLGVRVATGLGLLRNGASQFKEFAGPANPVDAIDAGLWERWANYCRGKVALRDGDPAEGWAAGYASKIFRVGKTLVSWLWQQGALANLPRNLDKRVSFDQPAAPIRTYSNAELRQLLQAARGQHKLHILLGLNAGLYAVDIAHLRRDEVSLANGTITRRRTKTRRQKHTPLVCYPLWPATLKLLREYMEKDGPLALRTPQGRPWATARLIEGKLRESHPIANYHQELCQRTGLGGSFKTFRKTSATRLRSNPRFADLRHHFLGESGKSIADRHYAEPDAGLFAEAVAWLGEQYGLEV